MIRLSDPEPFFAISSLAVLAVLAAGCGGGGGGSSDTESAQDWADGVCSAINTWTDSLKSAGQSLSGGNLSKSSLESAGDRRQGLDRAAEGRSQRPRQARAELRRQGQAVGRRRCRTTSRTDVDKIDERDQGRPERRAASSTALTDGDVHDLDDGHPGSDDVQRPEEARPQGRARVRVQQRELVQEPHVTDRAELSRSCPARDTRRVGAARRRASGSRRRRGRLRSGSRRYRPCRPTGLPGETRSWRPR